MKTRSFPPCIHFLLFLALMALAGKQSSAQVVVAQLSDTHIGEQHSPHAADNLRKAVEMINARHVDATILSGDIGEGPQRWEEAKQILKGLQAPLYYVPGNHDVHTHDVDRYRKAFGKDYYSFNVKYVTFLVIDSQLLGNYDHFDAKQVEPMPPDTQQESQKMLAWLASQKPGQDGDHDQDHDRDKDKDRHGHGNGRVIIGVQHIPVYKDGGFPNDPKPYFTINDPYRGQEMKILHELGIKDMFAGHWHIYREFKRDGINWHVAPATSWLPLGGQLGFTIHTISPDGDVETEFVPLGTQP